MPQVNQRHYESVECRRRFCGAGEQAKSFANVEKVCDWLVEKGISRDSVVIAVGGGVVGDITGFCASVICFSGGIKSLQSRKFLCPVLSTFMFALPRTYQNEFAEKNTLIQVRITGESTCVT